MSSVAPIPDVAAVFIRSTVLDKPVELCLWFRAVSPPVTQAKLDTIADRVGTAFLFNFSNVLGGPFLFREVTAVDRSPGSSLVSTITYDSLRGFNGTIEATSIALGLLNLTDDVPVLRKSISRVYAIPRAFVSGNVVDSVYADNLLGLWATNNQSHGPFGWHHVYVSLFSSGMPRLVGVSSRVTHYAVQSLVVSPIRYRLAGRPA
jgi:WD40 repeat protein